MAARRSTRRRPNWARTTTRCCAASATATKTSPPSARKASSDPAAAAHSVGARQTEHVFGDVGQDQVGRDRRGAVEPRLAPFALDVVFLGVAEAAMGLQAGLAGIPCRLRGQEL